MLIAQFDHLTADIGELRQLQVTATNAKAYTTRATLLQKPAQELAELARTAQLLRQHGVVISLDTARWHALAKLAREIATRYQADPQTLLSADESAPSDLRFRFWQPLTKAPNEAREALRAAWVAYVDGVLPTPEPDRLQTLNAVPGFASHIQEIMRLNQEASRLRNILPQSSADIGRVNAIGAELDALLTKLPSEGLSAEVREFLQAANTGSATFRQLTSTVIAWLHENHLEDSIRISLRGQAR
ncbi:MAG: hypothetical protein ABI068_15530 [Ktedonobacterales bacterium]